MSSRPPKWSGSSKSGTSIQKSDISPPQPLEQELPGNTNHSRASSRYSSYSAGCVEDTKVAAASSSEPLTEMPECGRPSAYPSLFGYALGVLMVAVALVLGVVGLVKSIDTEARIGALTADEVSSLLPTVRASSVIVTSLESGRDATSITLITAIRTPSDTATFPSTGSSSSPRLSGSNTSTSPRTTSLIQTIEDSSDMIRRNDYHGQREEARPWDFEIDDPLTARKAFHTPEFNYRREPSIAFANAEEESSTTTTTTTLTTTVMLTSTVHEWRGKPSSSSEMIVVSAMPTSLSTNPACTSGARGSDTEQRLHVLGTETSTRSALEAAGVTSPPIKTHSALCSPRIKATVLSASSSTAAAIRHVAPLAGRILPS